MSLQRIEMHYDGVENMFSVKGFNDNVTAEALMHILETIKDNTPNSALFDVRIKLIGKNKKDVEILTIKEFTKRIEDMVAEEKNTVENAASNAVIRITFYLSNGSMIQAECDIPTAHDVMNPYEKPELRECLFILFSDIHDRHYAIPYDNITAVYCDYLEKGSELHDIK